MTPIQHSECFTPVNHRGRRLALGATHTRSARHDQPSECRGSAMIDRDVTERALARERERPLGP